MDRAADQKIYTGEAVSGGVNHDILFKTALGLIGLIAVAAISIIASAGTRITVIEDFEVIPKPDPDNEPEPPSDKDCVDCSGGLKPKFDERGNYIGNQICNACGGTGRVPL